MKKQLPLLLAALCTATSITGAYAATPEKSETAQADGTWGTPKYETIDITTRDNTRGSLTYTTSEDKQTVEISYLLNGETVTYTVPNSAQYLSGPFAGTDDLGRSLYTMDDEILLYDNETYVHPIGVIENEGEHEVGLFYFLLLGEHLDYGIYNMEDILQNPASVSANYEGWGPVGAMHFFAEPLYGYYYSSDIWVMRRHVELLSNAGVDFFYIDVTNGYPYIANARKLMKVCHDLNAQGFDAPEIVFYTNTNAEKVVEDLYNSFYSRNLYSDTWYMVDGKPLIIGPETINDFVYKKFGVANFFSMRYVQWPTEKTKENAWPWIDWNVEQEIYVNSEGVGDTISVSVSQHSGRNGEGSWFSESRIYKHDINRGRSWYAYYDENGKYVGTRELTSEDSYKYGYNFQSQFNRAILADVKYVLVTSWNEWVAQRLDPAYAAVLGVDDRVIFVDTCGIEFSRDLEMTRGYYFDNYYMQLVANIQALKGAVPDVVQDIRKTINVTDTFTQWKVIPVTYSDPKADNVDRNNMSFGQKILVDRTGRNDIVEAKVTADNENLYFYVKTASNITYYDNDTSWMELYVNIDCDTTGWYGYDYLITDTVTSDFTASAIRFTGDSRDETEVAGEVRMRVLGKEMMVEVPLSMLGIENYKQIMFEFKWADSESVIDEMEDFYCEGDAAPLGRLNWVYRNYKGELPEESYVLGDITGDGAVDITDALLLFQHSMVPDVYVVSYPGSMDFNKDGNLDIKDAVLLFQHSMMPDVYPIS